MAEGTVQNVAGFRHSAITLLRDRAERLRARAFNYEALAEAIEQVQGEPSNSFRIGSPAEVAVWDMVTRLRD